MLPREVYMSMFFASTPLAIINFLLGVYVLGLGGDKIQVGLAYAAYSLFTVVSRPASGYIIDKGGLKKVLFVGMALLSLGLFWLSIAPDPANAIVAMAAVGMAVGFVNIALLVYITGLGGYSDPKPYGELTSASAFGGAIGAGLGFALLTFAQITDTHLLAMRSTFFLYTLMCLLPGLYYAKKLKDIKPVEESKYVNIGLLIYLLLATGLQAIGSGISYPMIMPFLVEKFNATPFIIALAFAPSGAAWILVPMKAGSFIKRYGSKASYGLATIISAVTVSLIPHVDNLITLSFLWFLEGVGLSIWYVFLQAAVPKASSSQIWGKAYGLQNLAYYAPYALGAFIGGVLYTFLGVYLTFYTAALFLVLAPLPLIVMSLRGIRLER